MAWITLFGALWSVPVGLAGIGDSEFTWAAVGRAVRPRLRRHLGIAFAMYGVLLHRSGPVRGMIGIFFTPIVGLALGVTVRDDELQPIAVIGMLVVIVGAVLTSRPEPAR